MAAKIKKTVVTRFGRSCPTRVDSFGGSSKGRGGGNKKLVKAIIESDLGSFFGLIKLAKDSNIYLLVARTHVVIEDSANESRKYRDNGIKKGNLFASYFPVIKINTCEAQEEIVESSGIRPSLI